MKIIIELECDFRPNETVKVGVDYEPDDLRLTVEQQTMLRGAASIAIGKIPATSLTSQ